MTTPIRLTIFLCLSGLLVQACTRLDDLENLTVESTERQVAVPLVNTSIAVGDVVGEDDAASNVRIKIDNANRVSLIYQGDVVRRTFADVFPPVPFLPLPLPDSTNIAPIPFATDQQIERAVIGKTNMLFTAVSSFDEVVTVSLSIPQLSKDGVVFEHDYTVEPAATGSLTYTSPPLSVEGWTLESPDNTIEINYDARLTDGTRVLLDQVGILFDVFTFSYIEGYFGADVFDISGSFIPVGVLDNWVSGGLSFADPRVNVKTENSYGFPVRSIFNDMSIVTTTGETIQMESDIITNNIDFDFPDVSEGSVVKVTDFSFTKDNSNIVELFEEKVKRVIYDIDAGANPDNDDSITNHVSDSSYFLVSVDVELPLEGRIQQLELQDTVDVDMGAFADVDGVQFKTVIGNGFPADIALQAYVYDEDDALVDSLFESRIMIDAAPLNATTGIAGVGEELIVFTDFGDTETTNLARGQKILINVRIDTDQVYDRPLWIYSEYAIDARIGAIITISE